MISAHIRVGADDLDEAPHQDARARKQHHRQRHLHGGVNARSRRRLRSANRVS
jgi:hypothetical protein